MAKMEIEENYFPLKILKCGWEVEAICRVVTKKPNVRHLGVGLIIYRNCSRNGDYDSGIECAKLAR